MTFVMIPPEGVKAFMAKLLQEEAFDDFGFKKAAIDNFARFDAEARENCAWGRMRPYIAALLKGGGKPGGMKIALTPPIEGEGFYERDPVANVLFNERGVTITFGGAWRSITEQRDGEGVIKEYVKNILNDNNITFTEE